MQKAILLSKRLGIAVLIAVVCRLLFYIFNAGLFSDVSPLVFLYGIRFDLSVIAILFAPFVLLSVLPKAPITKPFYKKLTWAFFHLANSVSIVLNCIDFEYYKFTLKRSTADLYSLVGQGEDFTTLLPVFLVDYWYVVVCAFLLIAASFWLYKKTNFPPTQETKILKEVGLFIGCIVLAFLAARGGLQAKPISIIQAGNYTSAANIPLVLNTPFTILQTLGEESIEIPSYYTKQELEKKYSPVISLQNTGEMDKKNVMIIIMESLSKEYIGAYNNYEGFTPFLDSLMQHSTVYNNCFANGKKSVEAMPAILAGIPALMNTPYIFSRFAANRINSFASVLKSKGYFSAFFHGGSNGTMAFDSFAKTAGFDHYYGRKEYGNDADYDGSWGIFDEPFFLFTAEKMNELKPPFVTALMSLSSHHPYTIPKKHKGKFKKGEHKIHPTIGYADYALKQFFKKAKKQDWYKNTVFVITADHTFYRFKKQYKTRTGMYAIPLVIFQPGYSKKVINTITQQTDILPTILSQLKYNGKIVAFGQTATSNTGGWAVNYINNTYQLIQGDYALQFNGEESIALYNIANDTLQETNLVGIEKSTQHEMENKLKAVIQSYNSRMMSNELSIE